MIKTHLSREDLVLPREVIPPLKLRQNGVYWD